MKNLKWIILGVAASTFAFAMLFFFNVISMNQIEKKTTDIQENQYVEIAKSFDKIKDDLDFYKYITHYSALLDEENYKRYEEVSNKLMDEDNKEMKELFLVVYMYELFKDEQLANNLENLKEKVYQEQSILTEAEKTALFEKNTSCLSLTSNITELLSNKHPYDYDTWNISETLDFITYSPILKGCIYVTDYTYDSDKDHYYKKIIYNVTTNNQIDDYTTYYFTSSYLSIDEQREREEKEEKEYLKYILENTNYNVELLGEVF